MPTFLIRSCASLVDIIGINTFKYHVLCTDGKISVRINLLCYLYFSTVVPSNICTFQSCRSFVVNTTFSTGLVSVEVTSVSWENVVLTTKDLMLDGTTVENKGKTIN